MQIKTELSSAYGLRNGVNGTLDVGGPDYGFCALHDASYRVVQGDEVCPRCEKWQAQDLAWRDEEDVHYNSGDDMGDSDE